MVILLQLFDFLDFHWKDAIDVLLVAILIYFLYKLVKGTIAFNIFIGLLSVYMIWWIVQALNMTLLSKILGQFIGVGVLALLIVFQQEIRKFLLIIGENNIFVKKKFTFTNILPWNWKFEKAITLNYNPIVKACHEMSKKKTGALIVITRSSELKNFYTTGVLLDAEISSRLINTIFFKNTPLHDGAMIVVKNRIKSASSILPVSNNKDIPDYLGLRHRAALGISEESDAIAIVISEERGEMSIAENGKLTTGISTRQLRNKLDTLFIKTEE